jgi:Amt family ammonium transporter
MGGSTAERRTMLSLTILSLSFSCILYPFFLFAAWSKEGFLYKIGYFDDGGSGVLHVTGGVAGLVATIMVGPRLGRFKKLRVRTVKSSLKGV